MEIVFCKPDALKGPHSTVSRLKASSLLLALASACDENDFSLLPEEQRAAAMRAARQIHERGLTEPSFKGTLVQKQATSTRLRHTASFLENEILLPTLLVLRRSIEGLGFSVEETCLYACRASDVEAIYPRHPGKSDAIHLELIDYLAGNQIEIWRLSGEQHPCTLQWWKTYARYLLKERLPNQEYLTRNLVHVCEGEDKLYLSQFFNRQDSAC